MAFNTNDYYLTDNTPASTQTDEEIAQKIMNLLKGTSRSPSGTYNTHLAINGKKVKSPRCDTLEEAWSIAADFYEARGNQKKASALRWASSEISSDATADYTQGLLKEAIGEIAGFPPEDCDEALLEYLREALKDFIDSHPPLNTELHERTPRVSKARLRESGPRKLECSLCGTPYTYPRVVGRPPAYCSSRCRSEVARITTKAWKVANGLS